MARPYIEREIKIETIRRIIVECSKNHLPAKKEQIISFASKEWGTERRKTMEYLQTLETDKIIKIDDQDIWTERRWEKIKIARDRDFRRMQDIIKTTWQSKIDGRF